MIGSTENLLTLHFGKLLRLHREIENTDQRLLVCRGEIFLVWTKRKSRDVLILLDQTREQLKVLNIKQRDFVVVHGKGELFISQHLERTTSVHGWKLSDLLHMLG